MASLPFSTEASNVSLSHFSQSGCGPYRKVIRMADAVDEIKVAAELAGHEHFMGNCSGGMPLIAYEDQCRFCGAAWNEKCRRSTISTRDKTSPDR